MKWQILGLSALIYSAQLLAQSSGMQPSPAPQLSQEKQLGDSGTSASSRASAAPTAKPSATSFWIFHHEMPKHPRTVTATEQRAGERIYQIYWSRTAPKRELFRVEIGQIDKGEVVKWWNYGINDELDVNGDGITDYSWYGGDDSGQEHYLFLSSPQGYRKVDLAKTLKAAWRRQYHRASPDFEMIEPSGNGEDKDCSYDLQSVKVLRSTSELTLIFYVPMNCYDEKTQKITDKMLHIQVEEAKFEY